MAAFEKATVGLFLWWSANAAFVDNPSRVLSISRLGVAETAEHVESGARSLGMTVLERTDHAALAQLEGYRLRPTQSLLVDGIGGDPIKLVIWQARSGITVVSREAQANGGSQVFDALLPDLLQALAPAARAAVRTPA
jgi:hypothetical protein